MFFSKSKKTVLKKIKLKYLLIILSLTFVFSALKENALAIIRSSDYKMSSPDYILISPYPNFAVGTIAPSGTQSVSQKTTPVSGNLENKILVGFYYVKNETPFAFSVSPLQLEFETLSSGVPASQNTSLSVFAGGTGGYQVSGEENQPLYSPLIDSFIPDTTGDDGTISQSASGAWSLSSTYGFGYTLFGQDVPLPFPLTGPVSNQYMQFADTSKNEFPQVLMSTNKQIETSRSANVTLKINVSNTQPAGKYQNIIIYKAIPTY